MWSKNVILREKWSHFDLKGWVIGGTKIQPGIPSIGEYLSKIESQYLVNFTQIFPNYFGIPGRILVRPVTQLFRSKWFHFFQCMLSSWISKTTRFSFRKNFLIYYGSFKVSFLWIIVLHELNDHWIVLFLIQTTAINCHYNENNTFSKTVLDLFQFMEFIFIENIFTAAKIIKSHFNSHRINQLVKSVLCSSFPKVKE